ncbi:putative peptide chain release factor-like protein mitochondrial [Cyphellophora attinorum]|uniref:Putative peptide chain release factor-like protein mitochondrial n=1 Tax=Cyphellophora attinorum TaxID=1664694 RepID=A0A0N0NKD4_9EURO|nr:putative peptide chain release factor-like protein mitochondrial [Phialophora attinorum]KPI37709.1 putative peptide chain release factor-like protein mitochondrial [Phialophora attinorum]
MPLLHTTAAVTRHLREILALRVKPTTATTSRVLSTTPCVLKQPQFPPRIQLLDSDLKHDFVLGRGPGGQVINKTASAAQITHLPTGIVVKNQSTRSRAQNYKIARQILADKVDEALNGAGSRPAVKQAVKAKKKASGEKKKRRKYRALAEGKHGDGGGDYGGDEVEVHDQDDEQGSQLKCAEIEVRYTVQDKQAT